MNPQSHRRLIKEAVTRLRMKQRVEATRPRRLDIFEFPFEAFGAAAKSILDKQALADLEAQSITGKAH